MMWCWPLHQRQESHPQTPVCGRGVSRVLDDLDGSPVILHNLTVGHGGGTALPV
ncbi:MAG: hypothetical protein N3A53_05040 [Verrucomicrobiae bacterium]|nr:hypothetical protein [Verrucomicrobiae bacterium]